MLPVMDGVYLICEVRKAATDVLDVLRLCVVIYGKNVLRRMFTMIKF